MNEWNVRVEESRVFSIAFFSHSRCVPDFGGLHGHEKNAERDGNG